MVQKYKKNPLGWLWGNTSSVFSVLLFPLTVVSWLYGLVIYLRLWFYQKGWLMQNRVSCHVISIGNITTGGTGKTPMTLYLAKCWQKKGYKVGIVSRGYRRKNKAAIVLVTDGVEICATPDAVGDEPYLMAQGLGGVPIVVSADRFVGCRELIKRFAVEVILLDDAFQHLKIHRDQNILIIDASNPFGNGHLLPRGPLRESLSSIKRSDVVIFTRAGKDLSMEKMIQDVRPYQSCILESYFDATGLIDLNTGEISDPTVLHGRNVLPFCGIGNPDSFLEQLRSLGAELSSACIFADHHAYKKSDLEAIQNSADKKNNTWIVTTEKDAVKIKTFMRDTKKIYALRIAPVFKKTSEDILERLFKK